MLLRLGGVILLLLSLVSCDSKIVIPSSPAGSSIGFYVVAIRILDGEELDDGRVETGPRTSIEVELSESFDADSALDAVIVSVNGIATPGTTTVFGPSTLRWNSDATRPGDATIATRLRGFITIDVSPSLRPLPGSEGGADRTVEANGSFFGGVDLPRNRIATTLPPAPPQTLAARPISAFAVSASWSGAEDNFTPPENLSYHVVVRQNTDRAVIQTVSTAPGTTQTIVSDLQPATSYALEVAAIDALGNLGSSVSVDVSTEAEIVIDVTPPTFAGVRQVAVPDDSDSASELIVRWDPAQDDIDEVGSLRYRVYLSESPDAQDFECDSCFRESDAGAEELRITDLDSHRDYFVVVRSLDSSGNEDENTVEIEATTRVSYASKVQPVLSNFPPDGGGCSQVGCHGGANASADLSLETYEQLLIGGRSTRASPEDFPIVVPHESASTNMSSYLMRRVDPSNERFQTPRMPLGAENPLTEAQLNILRTWISEGALDN